METDHRPDHGTYELRRKHQTVLIPTEDAGIEAAQVLEECLLDTLRISGRLGQGDDCQRRFSIGLWLRNLFDRAGLRPRVGMSFEPPVQGAPQMTESQAWNHRCWVETMRALPRHAYILREVCVFDRLPPGWRLRDIEEAL